jgi:hypothetical protein
MLKIPSYVFTLWQSRSWTKTNINFSTPCTLWHLVFPYTEISIHFHQLCNFPNSLANFLLFMFSNVLSEEEQLVCHIYAAIILFYEHEVWHEKLLIFSFKYLAVMVMTYYFTITCLHLTEERETCTLAFSFNNFVQNLFWYANTSWIHT